MNPLFAAVVALTVFKRVALVTGGTRGIGRGISETLAAGGDYDALLLTYNTNLEAAQAFQRALTASHPHLRVELVGGDLTTQSARDAIFECLDTHLQNYHLATVVHNAGQYVGITSDNVHGLTPGRKVFGNGSLLEPDGSLDTSYLDFYQNLYGTAFIDLCERSLVRMKQAHRMCREAGVSYRGSIVGISSPGCNANYKVTPGYDMPGSGKCLMEYAIRLYALQVAPLGINCNVVVPGVTRSDAWGKIAQVRGQERDEFLKNFVESAVPAAEVLEAKDIGDCIQFLAGKGGGRFLTGLSLRVDGGMHLKS
jgi:NAD(P)-dependent dehydrogenase (short-subunit alcohol dehydrogenase family)